MLSFSSLLLLVLSKLLWRNIKYNQISIHSFFSFGFCSESEDELEPDEEDEDEDEEESEEVDDERASRADASPIALMSSLYLFRIGGS